MWKSNKNGNIYDTDTTAGIFAPEEIANFLNDKDREIERLKKEIKEIKGEK